MFAQERGAIFCGWKPRVIPALKKKGVWERMKKKKGVLPLLEGGRTVVEYGREGEGMRYLQTQFNGSKRRKKRGGSRGGKKTQKARRLKKEGGNQTADMRRGGLPTSGGKRKSKADTQLERGKEQRLLHGIGKKETSHEKKKKVGIGKVSVPLGRKKESHLDGEGKKGEFQPQKGGCGARLPGNLDRPDLEGKWEGGVQFLKKDGNP